MSTYTLHTDPGHGWLKVPASEIKDLGCDKTISAFSYTRGDFVYLEEDRDMSIFISHYVGRHGKLPKIRERVARVRSSRIRNYSSYHGGTA